VEKISIFNAVTSLIFYYALHVKLYRTLLCDSSLLIMSAKVRKSEVFSYF